MPLARLYHRIGYNGAMHHPLPPLVSAHPPAYSRLLLLALAGVGLLVALFSTVWGAGATPDSATYVSAARNLQTGHGLWVQSDIHQSQAILYERPIRPYAHR